MSTFRPFPARPLASRPDPSPLQSVGEPASLLSADEERELLRRTAAGDRVAESRLVQAHRLLVARLARRYARDGLPTADLLQEGTVGLIGAVRRFDPERGSRLATYAAWSIGAAMQEYAVRYWSVVRLGKSAAHRALFLALRRADLGSLTAERLSVLAERFRLPLSEIDAMVRRLSQPDRSLDAQASGDPEPPSPLPTPEELASHRSLLRFWRTLIERSLEGLPAREAHIIRARHLDDPAPTFDTIGRELGISKDRVRQLERRALARLRSFLSPAVAAHGVPGE